MSRSLIAVRRPSHISLLHYYLAVRVKVVVCKVKRRFSRSFLRPLNFSFFNCTPTKHVFLLIHRHYSQKRIEFLTGSLSRPLNHKRNIVKSVRKLIELLNKLTIFEHLLRSFHYVPNPGQPLNSLQTSKYIYQYFSPKNSPHCPY